MSNSFRDSEYLGKSIGKKWSQNKKIYIKKTNKGCKSAEQKKKYGEFRLNKSLIIKSIKSRF